MNQKQKVLISFMLFSLFFGAGNLIFPPFLGQSSGSAMPMAMMSFLITAVALPVLGTVVVVKFNGLERLGQRVHPLFAMIFTLLIYLSIGPGLGIPRAASVPFEMAIAPYLSSDAPLKLFMVLYSFVFFAIATWLALTPNKLVERIGKFLTPSLLVLIVILFVGFFLKGIGVVGEPTGDYAQHPVVVGFLEGYNTMDTIAALNFGIVIATTIQSFGVKERSQVVKETVKTGLRAGLILSLVYVMLAYLGMQSSGMYALHENGAWTLRHIVYDVFGEPGALLLATIFTLACLTTCVGLITSISQYFSKTFQKVKYKQWVFAIAAFSFLGCNLGLNTILSISVPVLNMIYPISIVLIVFGLVDEYLGFPNIFYPLTMMVVGLMSVVYALKIPGLNNLFSYFPLYNVGLGWTSLALVGLVASLILKRYEKKPL